MQRHVTGPGLSAPCELTAASGEIVGIFGLVGAGRTELLKLIYGALPRQSGTIRIAGKQVDIKKPIDAIKNGMMYCPEDRKKEGIIPCRSVLENINLSARRNNMIAGIMLDDSWEKSNASAMIEKLAIKTPSLSQLIQNLSGGNQQKAILARWLSENIKVLLLDEPTRGIDVGAKSEIYSLMYTLASQGIGILMVSSDLPEILGVCDRIVVMCEGRIKGGLLRQQADSEKVMQMALPAGKRH